MIAANLCTKILDFRGFDSSMILILRGGLLMSIGNSLEILSQPILVGILLVGRLGVPTLHPQQLSCRHWLNGYFAQRVPSLSLASSFRTCLNCEALKGMSPWRTRHPSSEVPIEPVPIMIISVSTPGSES